MTLWKADDGTERAKYAPPVVAHRNLMVGMLRDGKKIRGGGHDDSAALYFPPSYSPEQIRTTITAALRTIKDSERPIGVTLGDLLVSGKSGRK